MTTGWAVEIANRSAIVDSNEPSIHAGRNHHVFNRQMASSSERGEKARANLVNALRECGELAEGVEHFEGRELLEVLDYLDSLRFVMAESGQILAGVVRGDQ